MTSINRQTVTWSQEPCRTVDRPFVHDNLVCKDSGGEAGADYARINLDPRLDRKIATRSEIKRLGRRPRGHDRREKAHPNNRTKASTIRSLESRELHQCQGLKFPERYCRCSL